MIYKFFTKLPTRYKVLCVLIIIIGAIILIRYIRKPKQIEAKKEIVKLVKCTKCKKLNPDEFPIETDPPQRMCDHCLQFFSKRPYETKNPCVFLELGTASKELGRIEIELYKSVVPKTAKNFYQLCVGKLNEETGVQIKKYMGTIFHNVVPGTLIQGGDYINGDGSGGQSIYGPTFPDENFLLRHEEPGLLSMANNGPNTNNSQFFIITRPTPWLDNKNVVFGKVIKGMEIIYQIERQPVDMKNAPLDPICIINCGAVQN